MPVTALQCPQCHAPVPPGLTAAQPCRYCGATLVVGDGGGSGGMAASPQRVPRYRDEEHFMLVMQVGPSNVQRVKRVLLDHGVSAATASQLTQPGECRLDGGASVSEQLLQALREAGASVETRSYWAKVAVPVDVAVFLVDAGKNKLGVISAYREHVKVSLIDAKKRVESAPTMLIEALIDFKAKALVDAIAAAGGRAEIR